MIWGELMALPVFDGLDRAERQTLRELAQGLLARKTFSPAGGLAAVDDAMATTIAAFAALPVLGLGDGGYAGWNEIIVYPGEFVPEREVVDEAGIVHRFRQPMSGEAWEGGPLVLSWADVEMSGGGEGYNVVIHEFAHKLDMRDGAVNGLPRLHSGMAVADWSAAFGAAYEDLCRRVDQGEDTELDPYAAENPAEFFAVTSEYFFEAPWVVADHYPAVYEQLRRYYRQDPLQRQEHAHHDPATP